MATGARLPLIHNSKRLCFIRGMCHLEETITRSHIVGIQRSIEGSEAVPYDRILVVFVNDAATMQRHTFDFLLFRTEGNGS